MFDPKNYELVAFSRGEKVERFGGVTVRRQTPSVPNRGKPISEADFGAQLSYRRTGSDGSSRWSGDVDQAWSVSYQGIRFHLKPTPTGQVGIFPEQASNWDWILRSPLDLSGLRAINLFGYTGGTTLALAKAGARVTHVDAAKTVVAWARENAAGSQLKDHPIRWITEDAMRFVKRELKRGNRYDIFVADPPSFGRGPSGETWKLERDFGQLLSLAAQLTDNCPKLLLISCHTPGFNATRLQHDLSKAWKIPQTQIESGTLQLPTPSGDKLACGEYARWQQPSLENQE